MSTEENKQHGIKETESGYNRSTFIIRKLMATINISRKNKKHRIKKLENWRKETKSPKKKKLLQPAKEETTNRQREGNLPQPANIWKTCHNQLTYRKRIEI